MTVQIATPPPMYYQVAIKVLTPLYRLLVQKKSKNLPTLSRELDERFGVRYQSRPTGCRGVIWCHAVSLGELNTAYPLLKKLIELGFGLWISSTTQTGFAQAQKLFADELASGLVSHSFVPVDNQAVIERFLAYVLPVMVLFIETELWANTLYLSKKHGIPTVMVNARLSEKSYQGYHKFAKVSASMMANISHIIAQDEAFAQKFAKLGATANQLSVADSLKWVSLTKPNQTNQSLVEAFKPILANRTVWVMASTHDGEEGIALNAHAKLCQSRDDLLLILVPRHPERFEAVYQSCQDSGLIVARRSLGQMIDESTQVYLADTMGELLAWYQLCDVAVVGGSFVPKIGGHNPIEPASFGKPIIMGQYDENCHQLVEALSDIGALDSLPDTPDVWDSLSKTLAKRFDAVKSGTDKGGLAKDLVTAKQSALQTQLTKILAVLAKELA
ncbi:3-deoxy-D-manno-octulosonic acid transferase [Moraxella nasicaprae]|uniref:3-deoxy-D-manno-octulosonic acid transferase n=1 Tax=Moraxella nasicaprae TaxID=2904122 RepID=A0ABY6F5L6_9GAMM|nr:3-deoxy-D-manno-octulosonic acid transferase [Moraxella nasicaprae]UXZ05394.1 3-deoxy-D-manno-octulosonic acid transferase [Moraxella nasicaprae]